MLPIPNSVPRLPSLDQAYPRSSLRSPCSFCAARLFTKLVHVSPDLGKLRYTKVHCLPYDARHPPEAFHLLGQIGFIARCKAPLFVMSIYMCSIALRKYGL
jgi:hypothetical protein